MKSYYNFAMKKILFVVFCLFISNNCFADKLSSRLQRIESVWEQVEAKSDETQQLLAFPRLLNEATTLANEFPHRAEPIILHACIILTHARIQGPFDRICVECMELEITDLVEERGH